MKSGAEDKIQSKNWQSEKAQINNQEVLKYKMFQTLNERNIGHT